MSVTAISPTLRVPLRRFAALTERLLIVDGHQQVRDLAHDALETFWEHHDERAFPGPARERFGSAFALPGAWGNSTHLSSSTNVTRPKLLDVGVGHAGYVIGDGAGEAFIGDLNLVIGG